MLLSCVLFLCFVLFFSPVNHDLFACSPVSVFEGFAVCSALEGIKLQRLFIVITVTNMHLLNRVEEKDKIKPNSCLKIIGQALSNQRNMTELCMKGYGAFNLKGHKQEVVTLTVLNSVADLVTFFLKSDLSRCCMFLVWRL